MFTEFLYLRYTGLTPWTGGGVITEKKETKVLEFRSLGEVLAAPGGINDGYGALRHSFGLVAAPVPYPC